jgi:oxaloacetate decarboxylase (Na+ extruding) subunit alpha
MERLARVVHAAGADPVPAVMYGISPIHTDEWFAARVREMVGWGVTAAIYVEDASGILKPERARTLLPALVEAAGDVPVELHCHNTTGMAPVNYLIGVECGIQRVHTASRPVANGPSLPSTEMTLVNLEAAGHTHAIDKSTLAPVAQHMEAVARQEGHPLGVPEEFDARIYEHQLPGGMTGTFKAQLAAEGLGDRFDAVLAEIPRVREELGHPVSATPFSQFIGTQALMNVISGRRYATTIDELALYVLGAYGQPPAPIDADVKDRILSTPRGRALSGWKRPEMTLDEVRMEYAGTTDVGDDELFRLHFAPPEDVAATAAAGPMRRDYAFRRTPQQIVEQALEARDVRQVSVRTAGVTLSLRR